MVPITVNVLMYTNVITNIISEREPQFIGSKVLPKHIKRERSPL